MGIMNIVDVLTCVFTFALALFAYKTWRISRQNARVELVFKLQEAYEHSVAGLFSKYFEDNVEFALDDISIRPGIAEREISFILSWFSTLGWMYEVNWLEMRSSRDIARRLLELQTIIRCVRILGIWPTRETGQ